MDFAALICFLALYYVRPQEWLSIFGSLHFVELLSVAAVVAMFRAKKLNPRDLVRTPLDWLVLIYFIWTLLSGGPDQFFHTLSGMEAVLLFYFVAVRSLDSISRQKTFLAWWCGFMLFISALAIASQYGFDPLGSADLTNGPMKGRLVLNLSVFDNPNTLAHSVIPAVPLIFYLLFWRRVVMKAWLILLVIPLYCVYLTQSKGAFLCGFVTLLATLIIGRSRITQIVILALGIFFGYGALYRLPRMQELNNARNDPAIQGRIAALTYGLQLMRENTFGIGLSNFQEAFTKHGPTEKVRIIRIIPAHNELGNEGAIHYVDQKRIVRFETRHYDKATHSAYNQNGAELGYFGLFLFVGILYCCIRTLLLVKSTDDDEERIRRALFATVVAYAASSWMVDFCYRPTFFMFVAAISAFHRHLLAKQEQAHQPVIDEKPILQERPWLRRIPPIRIPGFQTPQPAGFVASLPVGAPQPMLAATSLQPAVAPIPTAGGARTSAWRKPKSSFGTALMQQFIWTRLGILDLLIMWALTYATIRYWEHLIVTM